jgi:heptosyltransferase-2
MAQSLLKLLKTRHPDTDIDMLAPAWSLPVISRMSEVREGIVLSTRHGEFGLGKRRQLGARLRQTGYGQAIILPRSLKAALVPWLAGIPRRTGYLGEVRFGLINDIRPFDKHVLDQTVKRFVALGLNAGEALPDIPLPTLAVSAQDRQRVLAKFGLKSDRPAIAMMPGAEYGPAKCWPVEYFAELAGKLTAKGFTVLVLGSDKDATAGATIAADGGARNLCGQTELADVVDLLAACEQSVSNDSGLMHIAAAVGCKVSALYGSTSPDFTPPLTEQRVVHYLQLECSPCFKRECPLQHLNCLREITPNLVLKGLLSTDSGK